MTLDQVFSVLSDEDLVAVSTVPSGEEFLSRLTDGSGVDSALFPEISAIKNLRIAKAYRQRTTCASKVWDC
jgi:hypothetical protein